MGKWTLTIDTDGPDFNPDWKDGVGTILAELDDQFSREFGGDDPEEEPVMDTAGDVVGRWVYTP